MSALREHVLKRALACSQCARQVGALGCVGVLLASEAPSWLWKLRELRGEPLVLACEGQSPRVEVLDALQLPDGQRLELCLQLLDALAQLPQRRRGRCGRRRAFRECGSPLLWELYRQGTGGGQLEVVGTPCPRQLFDR